MSKIPKERAVPKPKSLSKTADVATQEHDELLRLTWSKLDQIADRLMWRRNARGSTCA